jgi:uncharacterized membrane protein
MKDIRSFTTINDLMHAVVIAGALVLSVFGLADELLSVRSERVLAATVYAMAVASVTYAAVLAQPSVASVRAALMQRRKELAAISL